MAKFRVKRFSFAARRDLINALSSIATGRSSSRPVLRYAVPAPVFGDLRTWHPAALTRPAFAFRRSAAALVVGGRPRARTLSPQVRFAAPARVAICIRRKTRREVLMARGVAGGRVRRPRRNQWSDVTCR